MKPKIIFKINLVLILLFTLATLVTASYDLHYTCPEQCVKNKTINWVIELSNDGVRDLLLVQVKVVNLKSSKIIAETKEAEISTNNPSQVGSDRPAIIVIKPTESHLFELNATLPIPNYGANLIYKICIKTMRADTYKKLDILSDFCYPSNNTIAMIDCTSDTDCLAEESCINNNCVSLNCTACQFIEDHSCNDFTCCQNSDCSYSEFCREHSCIKIDCNETNYLFNHTCTEKPCQDGEVMTVDTCIKSSCSYDEFLYRHACTKLNCTEAEGYVNHTCANLTCAPKQGFVNHTCQYINCPYNEGVLNHKCAKLSCHFFQKAEQQACLINSTLTIELFLLGIVLFVFLLDYKKYNGQYRKKIIAILLQKAKMRSDSGTNKTNLDDKAEK